MATSQRRQGGKKQMSPEQVAETLAQLTKSRDEEHKSWEKEQKERAKEMAAAKKLITKEIKTATSLVKKRESEASKIEQKVSRVEKQRDSAVQGKVRLVERHESKLDTYNSQRAEAEATLQAKMAQLGEARGRLAHAEFAASMLAKGVIIAVDSVNLNHDKEIGGAILDGEVVDEFGGKLTDQVHDTDTEPFQPDLEALRLENVRLSTQNQDLLERLKDCERRLEAAERTITMSAQTTAPQSESHDFAMSSRQELLAETDGQQEACGMIINRAISQNTEAELASESLRNMGEPLAPISCHEQSMGEPPAPIHRRVNSLVEPSTSRHEAGMGELSTPINCVEDPAGNDDNIGNAAVVDEASSQPWSFHPNPVSTVRVSPGVLARRVTPTSMSPCFPTAVNLPATGIPFLNNPSTPAQPPYMDGYCNTEAKPPVFRQVSGAQRSKSPLLHSSKAVVTTAIPAAVPAFTTVAAAASPTSPMAMMVAQPVSPTALTQWTSPTAPYSSRWAASTTVQPSSARYPTGQVLPAAPFPGSFPAAMTMVPQLSPGCPTKPIGSPEPLSNPAMACRSLHLPQKPNGLGRNADLDRSGNLTERPSRGRLPLGRTEICGTSLEEEQYRSRSLPPLSDRAGGNKSNVQKRGSIATELFEQLDTNADGVVTLSEFRSGLRKHLIQPDMAAYQ